MANKILILFCGGTIIMKKNDTGALVPMDKESALSSLFDLEPRLKTMADIDLSYIVNIDSSDMKPEVWKNIAEEIYKKYADYDGFVLTHGTDTMAYTASALSFALHNLGKPVVLTGAQIPGQNIGSDARRNLVNAMRVACLDVSGVFIVFNEKILRGVRASKISHVRLDAFASVNEQEFGEINVEIHLNYESKRHSKKLTLENKFDPKVAAVSIVPGMPVEFLYSILNSEVHGMVLIAYGSGNIPKEYLPFLQEASKKKVPIVIRTQCLEGATIMHMYETGVSALKYNVIQAFDMGLEATIIKFMWALAKAKSYDEVQKLMHTNYVEEIKVL